MTWEQLGRTAKRARDDVDRLREAIEVCPDRLSPELLNRSLLTILNNQVVILENMARLQRGLAAASSVWLEGGALLDPGSLLDDDEAEELGSEDVIAEAGLSESGLSKAERNGAAEDPIVLSVRARELQGSAPAVEAEAPASEASVRGERAERNGSATPIPPKVEDLTRAESARALQAFDNRDHNVERGLQKMNAWLSGMTGTPFQHRPQQHFAFLRVSGLSADKILDRERDLKRYTRLTQRLGRLKYEGLEGEVWLYGR